MKLLNTIFIIIASVVVARQACGAPVGINLAVDTRAWTVLQPALISVTPLGIQIHAAPGNSHAVAMLAVPFGDFTRIDMTVDAPEFSYAIWQRTGLNPFRDQYDRMGSFCQNGAVTTLRGITTDDQMKTTRLDATTYRTINTPWLPVQNLVSFIRYNGNAQFLVNGVATTLPVAGWENTLRMDNREPFHLLLFAGAQPVLLRQMTLALLQTTTALTAKNAIPIRFTLPADRYVTLVINDAKGNRVRNLNAETLLHKGVNVLYWDGTDDYGMLAAPGHYTARGLYRDALHLVYRFSIYNSGNPSWLTKDHTGGWLADHSPPMAVLAVGDRIFLGSPGSEANDGLIMTDLTGHKRWGWGYNVMDMNPTLFATDGKYLYCISDQGRSTLYRFDISGDLPKEVSFPNKPRFISIASYDLGQYVAGTHGMACLEGKLYIAETHLNHLLVYNAATGDQEKKLTVPEPRGLAVRDGKLYVRTGEDVAILNPADNSLTTVLTGTNGGRSLAFAPSGRLYLGDDANRQVRGYDFKDGTWTEVAVIGTAGGRQLGRFDVNAINTAYGMTVDQQGLVWIAEADFFPKRVSVFSAAGACVREFLGPPLYGGGGSIDIGDATRMFYNGIEFNIDWAKRQVSPYAVVTRIPEPYSTVKLPYENRGIDGRIYYLKGRRYYVTGDQYAFQGVNGLCLHLFDAQERAHPVAMLYQSKMPGAEVRSWTDDNGNGQIDDGELSAPVTPKMPDGRSFWSVRFILTAKGDVYLEGAGGVIFKVPLLEITPQGIPKYDLAHITMVKSFVGGVVSTVLEDGRIVSLGNVIIGCRADGSKEWHYPTVSLGVGQGGEPGPGRIVAAISLQGSANAGKEAGETFLINGNLGQRFLMTSDGLYIATLFRQYGSDAEKPKPATWNGGEYLDDTSVGPESFGGFYGKTSDGKIYVISGREDSKVAELTGLQTLRRFAIPLKLSARKTATLGRALTLRGEEAVALLHIAGQRNGTIRYLDHDAVKNNSAWKAWNGADGKGGQDWLPVRAGLFRGRAHLACDDTYLYFDGEMQTEQYGRSSNTQADWQRLASSGGSWEIHLDTGKERLRVVFASGSTINKVKSVNTTVIYRTVEGVTTGAAEVASPVLFTSADGRNRTQYATVARYTGFTTDFNDGQAWPHDSSYFNLSARVPLAVLGITLTPGTTLKGDVGVSLANDTHTGTLSRGFWTSPVGGVLDNPALAEGIDPALLGRLVVTTNVVNKHLAIPHVPTPFMVDGSLDEWAGIPFTPLLDAKLGEIALAHDGQKLYIAARVHTTAPMANNGADWTQLFKTGTAVDLQLATDTRRRLLFVPRVGGAIAILSEETAGNLPAAGEAQTQVLYRSPVSELTIGRVIKLASPQVIFSRTPDGFVMEAAIPLAQLGLSPGATVAGDFGILLSDADAKTTARRVYWANPDTSIVADLPSEARFYPQNWGLLTCAP